MKPYFLFFSFTLLPLSSHAQFSAKTGINVAPLIASSLEVTSEVTTRPWYSVSIDLGYTFKTGYMGMFDNEVGDGYKDRRTSGVYTRLGARFYTGTFGRSQKVRFYVNPLLVVSNYRQTAVSYSVLDFRGDLPVSLRGTVWIPGLRAGFTREVGERLVLDFGAQKTLTPSRDDMFGIKSRNYQPGAGSGQSTEFMGYLQGYLAVKWRL